MPLLLLTDSKITTDFCRVPSRDTPVWVCVNAAWPSLSSLWDHAVQMEDELIKLTWVSVEGERLSSFTSDGSIGEMKAWSPSTWAPANISNLSISFMCVYIKVHWSGDWEGQTNRHEFHWSLFDSFYATITLFYGGVWTQHQGHIFWRTLAAVDQNCSQHTKLLTHWIN